MRDDTGPASRADFDRIYREHHVAVERHLAYLTGDRQLAEDLTQETFGRLYERRAAASDSELRNPRAWLLRVASNLAYNHFRGETRRVAREGAREGAFHPVPDADMDDVLDVRRALEALDARDRTVLMLRHSGFSYAEIAESTQLAPSSIGTILARAQRRFREAYEGARPGAMEKE